MTVGVKLTGQWKELEKILATAPAGVKAGFKQAVMREAHYLAGQIKERIRKGPFKPLSANTLRMRKVGGFGGSKPLNVTGSLRNSVGAVKSGDGWMIGVVRNSGGGAGLAAVHEFGATIVMRMTPKMRRFLFGVLFKGSRSGGGDHGEGPGTKGTGILVIRIPARPFIRPTYEAEKDKIPARILAHLADFLDGKLGRP